ncbi:MAG: hypothetical protein IJO10_08475 [Clostridia bacterium]|nr:hypothetical protein [Clostridia bacterium]
MFFVFGKARSARRNPNGGAWGARLPLRGKRRRMRLGCGAAAAVRPAPHFLTAAAASLTFH